MVDIGESVSQGLREFGAGALASNFSARELIYAFGPGSLRLTKAKDGFPFVFEDEEKSLFLRWKYDLISLKERGYSFRLDGSDLYIQNDGFLPARIHLDSRFNKREILNVFSLLNFGTRYGFSFQLKESSSKFPRSLVLELNDKLVVVDGGIRFHLELIDPWTLVETFCLKIHDFDTFIGKTVIDVGSEFGDSALFFANRGATVLALEPVPANYSALLKNLALNPELNSKINPIKAAIAPEPRIRMSFHPGTIDGGATAYVSAAYGERGPRARSAMVQEEVEAYSLAGLMDAHHMGSADILKMDCKGCEFALTPTDFARIRESVKIEYHSYERKMLIRLLSTLNDSGFEHVVYLHNPQHRGSTAQHGTICARRVPSASHV